LTQKELYKIFKVDGATISSWEKGETKPQKRILTKLLEFIKINLVHPDRTCISFPLVHVNEPSALGDHIRNRRIELKLSQNDVAKIFNVRRQSIGYWEGRIQTPNVIHIPKIIDFLGYFPFEIDTSTLTGKLRAYCYRNGIIKRELCKILNIWEPTLHGWETQQSVPNPLNLKRIEDLLGEKLGNFGRDRT